MFKIFLYPENEFQKNIQKLINFILRNIFKIFVPLIKIETSVISGDYFKIISDSQFPNKKNKIIFSQLDDLEKIVKLKIKGGNWIFHNSDLTFDINEFKNISKLKPNTCFSTNMVIKKKNFYNIPIGLENFKYNKYYLGHKNIIKNGNDVIEKQANILYGFSMTNKERYKYISVLEKNDLCMKTNGWNNFIYKRILRRFMFVFCPRGNGYDTHRIWEAFYLKTVPILIKDRFNIFYKENKFPVIMINRINDINSFSETQLKKMYKNLKVKFNNKNIYPNYWKKFLYEKINK